MELNEQLWRKAAKSHEEGDACIELASIEHVIAVRDSKDPNGPRLTMCRSDFRQLAETLKNI
ncbi:DUF397 domain-containing protein [Actinomadura sp. NTSP31]|uniref:DUF397 domain-containing protein n=1 Tax=Actinomadura sp. NTSP31 TaxID=1735447 RepID=UPI0035BF0596